MFLQTVSMTINIVMKVWKISLTPEDEQVLLKSFK